MTNKHKNKIRNLRIASTRDLTAVINFLRIYPGSNRSFIRVNTKLKYDCVNDAISWLKSHGLIEEFHKPGVATKLYYVVKKEK